MTLRVGATLILISQLLLAWVGLDPNGTSAIWFTFVGTPCLVIGIVLATFGMRRPS